MNHLAQEMVAYYHESRPHQAKDNNLLVLAGGVEKAEEPGVVRLSDIRCKKRLGGLLRHYCRKAACRTSRCGVRVAVIRAAAARRNSMPQARCWSVYVRL